MHVQRSMAKAKKKQQNFVISMTIASPERFSSERVKFFINWLSSVAME